MYSLIPQAMAMGFSSILLSLFIITELKGSVFDVGLIASVFGFSLIPSLILWGNLADRFGKCKIFILLSFGGLGITFLLISAVKNVYELLILTVFRSISYAASIPTRQILIVESEDRRGWERGISRLEFMTGLGEGIGIALGVVTVSTIGFRILLILCGSLCFLSAITSLALIQDPGLMIERRLMGVERFVNTLVKASNILSRPNSYLRVDSLDKLSEVFKPSIRFFMLGIFCFSLAGSMFFTALPIYFLSFYTASTIFLLYYGNSIANTISYIFISRSAGSGRRTLLLSSATRMILIPLLMVQGTLGSFFAFTLAAIILTLLGITWALFDVSSTCLYIELSSIGRAGFYSALLGLGSAIGGFLGGYVSSNYGFEALFTICSSIYAFSLVLFALQFKKWSSL
jgi:MFS family permease